MKTNLVQRWFLSKDATQTPRTASRSSSVPEGRATLYRETSGFSLLRLACAGMLVTMLAGFASVPAYGDEDIGFKYPFGDDRGTENALISSVSVIPLKEGGPEPKPGETGAKLRVTVKEGPGYNQAASGWDFFKVLDGSHPTFKDTDSAQTAVRWSKQGTADVGHDTNAKALGVRGSSATWTKGNTTKPNRDAYWETDIPTEATHVEVVLVYTDILYDTNAQHSDEGAGKQQGDAPAVIGSWSGDLQADGTWKFTKNDADLFVHQADYPTFAQITAFTTAAKGVVNTKTGYTLKERPATLAGIPINNGPAITAAINTAIANNQINPGGHDTGFDILRR